MMTATELRERAAAIHASFQVLERCRGPHDFLLVPGTVGAAAAYRCKLCGGELDGNGVRWYAKGLEHGRKASGVTDVPRVHG